MVAVLLALAASIHLLPLSGVRGRDALHGLYAVEVRGPDLLLAMRHRAAMFGIFAIALVVAIAFPELRRPVILATLCSDVAFLVLAWGQPLNRSMKRVVVADLVSILALLGACIL